MSAASGAIRAGALAAVVWALLIACGCGGSSRPPAYVASGNAICSQELAGLDRYPEPTTPAQAIGYLPHAIAYLERISARLQALSPPAKPRAQLDAALMAGSRLIAVLRRFLRQLRSSTVELTTFAQVQTQSTELRTQISAHMKAAGLPRCVSS